jgi:hypothetical protein
MDFGEILRNAVYVVAGIALGYIVAMRLAGDNLEWWLIFPLLGGAAAYLCAKLIQRIAGNGKT